MLTDEIIKAAESKEKNYKLYDTKGLYILVTTKGSKIWRYKYHFQRKEQTLSLGLYPEISIDQAREEVKKSRLLIKKGYSPGEIKKVKKQMTISSPIKILRKELAHLDEMRERLLSKQRDIQNQLDDVSYDLSETTQTVDELRDAIKYLEEGLK